MKTKIFVILTILLVFICQISAKSLWITSVDIIPSQPSDIDPIVFNISGYAGHSPFPFTYDQFTQDGETLRLDLHFDGGGSGFDIVIPWTCSKQIQPLSAAIYNLEVRAFDDYDGLLQDTYTVDFTVVPEPTTLIFFAVALPVFRVFSRKKSKAV